MTGVLKDDDGRGDEGRLERGRGAVGRSAEGRGAEGRAEQPCRSEGVPFVDDVVRPSGRAPGGGRSMMELLGDLCRASDYVAGLLVEY